MTLVLCSAIHQCFEIITRQQIAIQIFPPDPFPSAVGGSSPAHPCFPVSSCPSPSRGYPEKYPTTTIQYIRDILYGFVQFEQGFL